MIQNRRVEDNKRNPIDFFRRGYTVFLDSVLMKIYVLLRSTWVIKYIRYLKIRIKINKSKINSDIAGEEYLKADINKKRDRIFIFLIKKVLVR